MNKEINLKQKNELAETAHQKLIQAKNYADIAYLYVGKQLKKIKEEKLYEYLGNSPEYESFPEYIKSPEINIEQRKAYYLIQIYETFCETLQYQPEELKGLSWTTLRALLPITNQADMEEWLSKARELSRADLELEIKQLKSGIDDSGQCSHQWEKIVYWKCKECGERSKVEPSDGKIINN